VPTKLILFHEHLKSHSHSGLLVSFSALPHARVTGFSLVSLWFSATLSADVRQNSIQPDSQTYAAVTRMARAAIETYVTTIHQ
jgi:hypothetical protein